MGGGDCVLVVVLVVMVCRTGCPLKFFVSTPSREVSAQGPHLASFPCFLVPGETGMAELPAQDRTERTCTLGSRLGLSIRVGGPNVRAGIID